MQNINYIISLVYQKTIYSVSNFLIIKKQIKPNYNLLPQQSLCSKVIIYFMNTYSQHPFLTPIKNQHPFKPIHHQSTFESYSHRSNQSHRPFPQSPKQSPNDSPVSERLIWFQARTSELRRYLSSSIHIQSRKIKEIFGWESDPSSQSTQQQLLKELSAKVKTLIKQNQQLRCRNISQQLQSLTQQNQHLIKTIQLLKRGETAREDILDEQNKYLRAYIEENRNFQPSGFTQAANIQQIEEEKTIRKTYHQQQTDKQDFKEKIKNQIYSLSMKFQQKVTMQALCIEALEHRLQEIVKLLQTVDKRIQSVNIQKKANWQTNYQQKIEERVQMTNKKIKLQQVNEQIVAMVMRSAKLQQELDNLQQKYDIEIQKHIQDNVGKQHYKIYIEKLKAERQELLYEIKTLKNPSLQKESNTSNKRGIKTQKTYSDNDSLVFKHDLQEVKKDLKSICVEKLELMEKLIPQLVAQRQSLKRELSAMSENLKGGNRYAAVYKQLFLVKQKNTQLQQNCKFYQHQIQQYQNQLRQLLEENQEKLARDISKDIREMVSVQADRLDGLEWLKKTHNCILNSIKKIELLEERL